jgi:U3 small nucleolar RNA-associated protein 15
MELQTGEYQKLQVRQYPQRALRETAEGRYWKQFRGTTALQQVRRPAACCTLETASNVVTTSDKYQRLQIGGVSHIDFASVYPFNYAVTSSTRVSLVPVLRSCNSG